MPVCVCQRCGKKWEYKGRNKFAYCYSCNRAVTSELKKKQEITKEFRELFMEIVK